MENFFPILKQCPLFAHIAESDLSAMLHCLQVTVQHYDKGQIVIHEGEKAERFGIVLTGAVQLWRIDYSGNRSIMANVEPAQIFGESFVCAEVESIPIQAVASACKSLPAKIWCFTRSWRSPPNVPHGKSC